MTSCGPNSQSYNFTHMFEFVDLRGNLPKKEYNKNSISYFLNFLEYLEYFPQSTKQRCR